MEENLRGDLSNPLGMDIPLVRLILASRPNDPAVRDYVDRRIEAGNECARLMKRSMEREGTW